ncbi:MAG: hypothetical protein ABI572_07945 [Actinomycetota bacterium]
MDRRVIGAQHWTDSDTPQVWRGTGALSIAAGVAWVVFDARERFSFSNDWSCDSTNGYLMNAVDTIAMLGLASVLLSLFFAFRADARRWLSLPALSAALGFAIAGTVNLIEHCVVSHMIESSPLGLPPYTLGGLIAIPSVILFALALTRVRGVPRWCAWTLVVGAVSFPLLGYGGGILIFGLAWVVFGAYLLAVTEPGKARAEPPA